MELQAVKSLRQFVKQRARAAGLAAILGMLVHAAGIAPAEGSLAGLALLLGKATQTHVQPQDIAWEQRRGFFSDTFTGRKLLFLGAAEANGPRDVYRAQVRVSWDGKPLSVRNARNLTETPAGDDVALQIVNQTAVYATVAYDRIQAISVLELDGIRPEDRSGNPFQRLLNAITQFQQTSTFAGIGRVSIIVDVPSERARLLLDEDALTIDLGSAKRDLRFDLATRKLLAQNGQAPYGARAVPQIHPPKPVILWLVDTVRAELGPTPIAWLENKVFGLRDVLKRLGYALLSSPNAQRLKAPNGDEPGTKLDSQDISKQRATWPPPPISSLWEKPEPNEGHWLPVELPFLKRLKSSGHAGGPPSYFYKTFIRPDPERPYSQVHFIAFDMRQLRLGIQAGYEDPKPTTGPPGDGRLPDDPEEYRRVVATFNGAFKTTHGQYGMMVNGRVLVPPVVGAASIIVDDEGRTGMGNWPDLSEIPENIVSLRQNLDPLVEDGTANPSGRYVWGWEIEGQGVLTQRTALCVTEAGHLYYAFAEEANGPTLGRALQQAGCVYGVHLDMNPGHCGFIYTDIVDLKNNNFSLQIAHPKMKMRPDKFLRYSPKDFFYLMLRQPQPTLVARDNTIDLRPDGGAQPAPDWLPGIFTGNLKVGTQAVELTTFEPGRFSFRLIAGTLEPTDLGAPLMKIALSGRDTRRVLAAIGLGHTTDKTRLGIAFDGQASLQLREGYATLTLDKAGQPALSPSEREVDLGLTPAAAQLPLLVEDGHVLQVAHERGARRLRSALCIDDRQRVLIARVVHDTNTLVARALVELGCSDVVELDRGSHHPAFIHRADTETPPLGRYEGSVLYVLGNPARPGAYRWKHAAAKPASKPTGFDIPREKAERARRREPEP